MTTENTETAPELINGATDVNFQMYLEHLNVNFTKPYGTQAFGFMQGRKYIRVVAVSVGGGRSVHTFVDRTNGNILKSASWKQPETKNPRGNINNGPEGYGVTEYGAVYLR